MLFNNMTNCKSNCKTPVNKSNTRKPLRIFCHDCNLYTDLNLLLYEDKTFKSFKIFATCNKCKTFNILALKDIYYEKFPHDYFNLPLGKQFMNTIITNKGETRNILQDLFSIINEQFSEQD